MFVSAHKFIRPAFALLGFVALAVAFHLGSVAAQQQMPVRRVDR